MEFSMRVFWSIIGLLVVVSVVLLLRDGNAKVDPVSRNDVAAMDRPAAPPAKTPDAAPTVASANPTQVVAAVSEMPTSQPDVDAAAELAKELMAAAEKGTATTVPATQPAAASSEGEHAAAPAAPKSYEAKVDPAAMELAKHAKIEQQPDGSVLLDNKFTVRGSGTAEDPYQLSWDLLTSASETYQPRLGLTQVPQRVSMLDGKHVKITGYMAFPLAQMEAKEVLMMLNMWDGCCIGIPPSPYDAVEVQLAEAIPYDKRRLINYGTLTGVMKVDPYLVNDWLLGLYLVEDAKLDFGL